MMAEEPTDPRTFDVKDVIPRVKIIDPTLPVDITAGFYLGLLERIEKLQDELRYYKDQEKGREV